MLLLLTLACASLSPAWTLEAQTDYATTPVEAGGLLFTAAVSVGDFSGLVHALSRSGEVVWTLPLERHQERGVVVGPDGELVVAEASRAAGLAPADGEVLWEQPWGLTTKIAASDRQLVVTSWDNGISTLHGLDGGVETWASEPIQGDVFGLSLGADGVSFAATEAVLVAVDDAGATLWSNPPPVRADFMALDREGVVLVQAGAPGQVARISRADGSLLWQVEATVFGAPVIDQGGTLYFPGAGILAMDEDGEVLWQGEDAAMDLALGSDDRLYAWGPVDDGWGNADFTFAVFSTADGDALWRGEQFDAVDTSNGSPNLIGGRAYYAGGSFNSGLYAFGGAPGLGRGPWPRAEGGVNNGRSEQ